MSNFITKRKHPIDGDMRQCLALDDFFRRYKYGFWFIQKQFNNTTKLSWSTKNSVMEGLILSHDGVEKEKPPKAYLERGK